MLKEIKYTNAASGEIYSHKSRVDMQFDEQDGYLFWSRKQHVKTFTDRKLPGEFTWAEKGRLSELKHYMLKKDQLLVYRSGNVLKPIAIHDVARLFDMSDRQAKALIAKSKKHSIIKELEIDGVAYYAYNPIYALKSKRISLMVYLIFQNELKKELPPWVVKRFAEQAEELKPDIKAVK
jgi:predicted DNA-binding transcriptional regulator